MTTYLVNGAAVVLPTADGSEKYLYRGALIGDGFTEAGIAHAISIGLIEEVEELEDVAERLQLEREVRETEIELEFEARVQQAAAQLETTRELEFQARVDEAAEKLVADREAAAKSESEKSTPPVVKAGQTKPVVK